MKKLILSSVFAGLVLAASGVEASTAVTPKSAPYGNFVINADFTAGWWANFHHSTPDGTVSDTIDKDDFKQRQLVALADTKMTFKTEGGCSAVAFGAVVKLDVNAAAPNLQGIFRDTYVFGRFGNMIEVRIGSQRDAMWSLVDADSVMGGTGGYNGYYGNMLKYSSVNGALRKDRWMLDLTHANDTWYTNALEVRTMRLAGIQAVANWKPSSVYNGRLGTYGDGSRVKANGVQNNLLSLGLNYDNTFGDIRVRASAGGVYGLSDQTTASGEEANTSLTYRVGGVFSWKSFDFGLGWLDNRNTGFSKKLESERNAGKGVHGVIGYQFDTIAWKPRLSVGALYGWKNGRNDSTVSNDLANQDGTLTVSGAVDLNIRDGFRWFVEGVYSGRNEKNDTAATGAKDGQEADFILGTGLAVSQ